MLHCLRECTSLSGPGRHTMPQEHRSVGSNLNNLRCMPLKVTRPSQSRGSTYSLHLCFKKVFFVTLYFLFILHGNVCVHACKCTSHCICIEVRKQLAECFSFTIRISGPELKPSSLIARTFSCRAISLVSLFLSLYKLILSP